MPTYIFECEACKNEFEEYQMMSDPFPPCPECKGIKIRRLIAGGSGRGIVELTGHDLKAKLKEDVKKIKQEARKNENLMANLVGPSFDKIVK